MIVKILEKMVKKQNKTKQSIESFYTQDCFVNVFNSSITLKEAENENLRGCIMDVVYSRKKSFP